MVLTREQLESLEKERLASYAIKNLESQGRDYSEEKDKYRLDFQRDRDRIIHSHAFRRLREKTQVFVANYGDHYRNRLTHTLEVAQLSRDIAKNLNLNEDLADTIALAHDLGHTPFGHGGETAMNRIMKEYGENFEHNEQSKRIVELLEKKSPNYPGLNLTFEVRDGLIKHRTSYDKPDVSLENNASLEAQVVNLADEMAYQNHDLDDGVRSGILKLEDLEKLEIWRRVQEKAPKEVNIDRYFPFLVSILMKQMIEDLYTETSKRIESYNIKNLKDVYNCKDQIVSYSKDFSKINDELKNFLYKNLYYNETVIRQSKRGADILEFLFRDYYKAPPENLEKLVTKETPLYIVIKDYIAGMTDEYAQKQFNK